MNHLCAYDVEKDILHLRLHEFCTLSGTLGISHRDWLCIFIEEDENNQLVGIKIPQFSLMTSEYWKRFETIFENYQASVWYYKKVQYMLQQEEAFQKSFWNRGIGKKMIHLYAWMMAKWFYAPMMMGQK